MLQVYDARKQGLDAKDIHLKYIKKINVREWKELYNKKHYNDGIEINEQDARRLVYAQYSKNIYRYKIKVINLIKNAAKGIFPKVEK